MSDINVIVNDQIVNIDVIDTPVLVNVVNSPGVPGAPGQGVPVGGTTGQVLKKLSNTNYDTYWAVEAGGISSIGLTMPSAFAVANSPLTANGTLAVTGAGTTAQYIRGDGQLANFPSSVGGGSAYNYYLNGSVNQGTFGGDVYYEMSKTPVLGAGTNFTRTNAQGNGYIASFITDAGDPSLLNIPAGNWNVEFYFQANSNAGNPQFYAELYKVDASNNFTLVGSGSTNPEGITNGTTIDQYYTAIPVPQTSLLVTDRLAIRIYVIPSGRTITLHTENSNLCEILTTLSTGLNALNGLTAQVQYFATGTSGTDFAISSATDTHTFNLPTASSSNRGALSSADWAIFNAKQGALTLTTTGTSGAATLIGTTLNIPQYSGGGGGISGSGASGQVAYWTGTSAQTGSNNLFWDATNSRLGIGTNAPANDLSIVKTSSANGEVSTLVRNLTATGSTYNAIFNDLNQAGALQIFGSTFATTSLRNSVIFTATTDNGISFLANSNNSNAHIKFVTTTTQVERMRIINGTGNVLIQNGGTFTDSGERLQVAGTMKVTGASSFGDNLVISKDQNAFTSITLRNLNAGTNSEIYLNLQSDTTAGNFQYGKYSSSKTTYKIVTQSDAYFYNTTRGDFAMLNDYTSGNIKFAAGGSSTAHMTIKSNGRINMSSLPTSSTGLATGDLWNNGGVINIV